MAVNDVTGLITALTALAIAIGGVITAIKVLREIRIGNDKTDAVHDQLNSAKTASDRLEQDYRHALQEAGISIPTDRSLRTGEESDAVQSPKG